AAAAAAAVAAVTPPPVRPAVERTTPPPPTDKSVSKTSGDDTDRPPVLPGPGGDEFQPPRPVEPRVGPDRPRPGLTMKTDGAAPALDRTAPTPADPVVTEPVTFDPAAKLDAGAPVAIARDAGLSSLSRATIETTAHLAAQITRKLEGRSTRFEMALTPEGLGRVDVSLDIDADGQLAARLAFDNPVAAMDLRGRVDELRRQLEDQGFKLADDALQFTNRDPQGRGDGFDGRRERAFARSNRLNDDADLELSAPVAGRWMSLSLTPDRVDLKV
ncbi:MAG TPA: flagellar hook-length control protein FliK, partial [Brevundimonas sp.]